MKLKSLLQCKNFPDKHQIYFFASFFSSLAVLSHFFLDLLSLFITSSLLSSDHGVKFDVLYPIRRLVVPSSL